MALANLRRSLLAAALAGLCAAGCGGPTRFALRPPVLRDSDDRPFPRALPEDEESDYAQALDVMIFGPISRALWLTQSGESRNVNALDEVPDSTWFTNRSVPPAALERGPCPAEEPVPPFLIKSSKTGGTTPGFAVKDARGKKFMIKRDTFPRTQPEISTASDSIVSRLYWAIGFNTPCNNVIYIEPTDLLVDSESTERNAQGEKLPLNASRVAELLRTATPGPGGKLRVGANRFIDGEPAGTWRTEGMRSDDPNDVIPHEDRRELRGERFLAAWVKHWDSRGPNTFDAFVRAPGGGGGYVLHYFLDFSDSLGATAGRTKWPEPRMGFTTVTNVPTIAADAVTFGFVRRPWDEVKADPRYPNLGYYDVEHFEPMDFAPQTPLIRWARAESTDLAWMARKLARLTVHHVRQAVKMGRLSNPAEAEHLVEVMMARRDKILRLSFSKVSPLAELAMTGPDRLCALDLGVLTGLDGAASLTYALDLRQGADLRRSPVAPPHDRKAAGAQICVDLPRFAAAGPPDDSPERYVTLDVVRTAGEHETTLRAHFYDLGPGRGHALVGVERL